jgi:LmbE family N-acetylglucosaminyl deacetylase
MVSLFKWLRNKPHTMKTEEQIYPYTVNDYSDKDAIVLAPHPDDESIGCGGSILKHVRGGRRVKVIFLTNGDKGDFKKRFGKDYLDIRLNCAKKALSFLGVNDYEFWGYRDRELHLAEGEIIERLFLTVKDFSHFVIYAPSPFEIHPDHRTTFSSVWKLIQRVPLKLLLYETLVPFYPDILVDITNEWPYKKNAIESYWTELYYNNYSEKVEGLNRYRTSTLSKDVLYAEGFLLVDGEKEIDKNSLQWKLLQTIISFHSIKG